MSISISISSSPVSFATANSSSSPPAAQKAPQPTNDSADTVTLTESQRVYQLYNQGQAVLQIASSLSLTVDAVNSYLNISGSK